MTPLASLPRSAWALVGANLLPVLGVLLLGWDLGAVMLLFWVENVVIGAYHVLRMALVMGRLAFILVPFFVVHYGLFTLAHGALVIGLFVLGFDLAGSPAAWSFVGATFLAVTPAILALVASHGASFVLNFLRGGERARMRAALGSLRFRKTGPRSWTADVAPEDLADPERVAGFTQAGELMTAPYKRVVDMHVTLIGAGFLLVLVGTPRPAILLLALLKLGLDLRAHLAERRRLRAQVRSPPPASAE